MAEAEVRENAPKQRFEIWVGDQRAGFTLYQGHGSPLSFVHTEIDPAFGGQGLGSILIRQALDTVRARGVEVLPFCPFVKAFIQKHPDYLDLVPAAKRAGFGLPEEAPA
jgi:predicted GNAT family acetyltransferase